MKINRREFLKTTGKGAAVAALAPAYAFGQSQYEKELAQKVAKYICEVTSGNGIKVGYDKLEDDFDLTKVIKGIESPKNTIYKKTRVYLSTSDFNVVLEAKVYFNSNKKMNYEDPRNELIIGLSLDSIFKDSGIDGKVNTGNTSYKGKEAYRFFVPSGSDKLSRVERNTDLLQEAYVTKLEQIVNFYETLNKEVKPKR